MKPRSPFLPVAALLLAGAAPVWPCDSSTCALITRGQNGLLARGVLYVDFAFRYTDDNAQLRGSSPTDSVLRPKVDFERQRLWPGFHEDKGGSERFVDVGIRYGLTSRTTLVAAVPVLADRSYEIGHVGIPLDTYTTRGVGDGLLGVRQALGPLVVGLSLKLPIGDYKLGGDYLGGILDPTLQPGSGSFDLVGLLQWSRRFRGLDCSFAGSYQRNGTNSLTYRFGDGAIAAVGVSRSILPRWSFSLQAKLTHQDRSSFLGGPVPSTGSTIVYANPGLHWQVPAAHATSVFAFLQLPAYRYVNDAQLAPRRALLVGISRALR